MKKEALINDYISAVSSAVICQGKKKRCFLECLRQDAEDFLNENGGATRAELESVFGSPEDIAASMLSNSESSEIKRKISLKKTVIVAVLAVLFIYLAFVVLSLVDVHYEAHGYVEEGIMCIFAVYTKGGAV